MQDMDMKITFLQNVFRSQCSHIFNSRLEELFFPKNTNENEDEPEPE